MINLERIGAVLGVLGTLGGAWVYLDANFASAADLKRLEGSVNQAVIELRKKAVDDKIFDLQFKQNQNPAQMTPLDKAQLERYKRELNELQNLRN